MEQTSAIIHIGMGSGGAKGAKQLNNFGDHTIAYEKFTSIVWGKPDTAVKLEAASDILAVDKIPR